MMPRKIFINFFLWTLFFMISGCYKQANPFDTAHKQFTYYGELSPELAATKIFFDFVGHNSPWAFEISEHRTGNEFWISFADVSKSLRPNNEYYYLVVTTKLSYFCYIDTENEDESEIHSNCSYYIHFIPLEYLFAKHAGEIINCIRSMQPQYLGDPLEKPRVFTISSDENIGIMKWHKHSQEQPIFILKGWILTSKINSENLLNSQLADIKVTLVKHILNRLHESIVSKCDKAEMNRKKQIRNLLDAFFQNPESIPEEIMRITIRHMRSDRSKLWNAELDRLEAEHPEDLTHFLSVTPTNRSCPPIAEPESQMGSQNPERKIPVLKNDDK